jgi:serine/threonine-protein kinase
MAATMALGELLLRWQELHSEGQHASAEHLCADCPELLPELRQQIEALRAMEALLGMRNGEDPAAIRPGAGSTVDLTPPSGAPLGSGTNSTPRFTVGGYEVLDVLDRGGMGIVYRARQVALKRVVALKMILAGAHAGPGQRVRFRTEAEALARLRHANIVQIYEVGEIEDRPYFAMEYVEGGSLADRLAGTPLPSGCAAELTETLARAVDYAHQRGIVHRDLKPANVLLQEEETTTKHTKDTKEGKQQGASASASFRDFRVFRGGSLLPKITDFGLAKILDEDNARTHSGQILGTPSYMAPEQAEGSRGKIGPAVDVYALGASLYEMLTGRPPFKGETTLDTLEQVRLQEPVPPRRLQPKVPRDLETICLKCLHKEPSRRYRSAAALADDLQRFLRGQPILARPASLWSLGVRWARRQPALAGLIAVSVLAVASLLGIGVWFTEQVRGERDHAREEQRQADRERQTAQRERDEANRQRERAETILSHACAAVDEKAWRMVSRKGAMEQDRAPGNILYNLACVYAQAAESTRRTTALSLTDRQELIDRQSARAVELLQYCRALGLFKQPDKLERLQKDRDLDPLRGRSDFRKLLADVQAAGTAR